MNVAIVKREATAQTLPRYVVTAGGLLWRRRAGDFYVCLVTHPESRLCEIPRARMQEDERLSEAAVRIVRSETGFLGKPEKQLARAVSADNEIACLFLMQCSDDPRFESEARKMNAIWFPLERSFDLLATASERMVVRRAALALSSPIDPGLPFEDEIPAVRATSGR